MLAVGEIRLGCLRLLGQAEFLIRVAAFLTIATSDVHCALLRRYFGVFWLARLIIAVVAVPQSVSVMKKRQMTYAGS